MPAVAKFFARVSILVSTLLVSAWIASLWYTFGIALPLKDSASLLAMRGTLVYRQENNAFFDLGPLIEVGPKRTIVWRQTHWIDNVVSENERFSILHGPGDWLIVKIPIALPLTLMIFLGIGLSFRVRLWML